jgi:glycosyltransferase involved in cell wall biosynthesis
VSEGAAPLRVLVNLTWLVPGVVGGSEESTTDALRAVLEYRPDIQPHLAVLRPFLDAHPDLAEACRCDVLDLSGANKVVRVWKDQTWLSRRTLDASPDVVHHAGGVVPLRHPGRVVVTIHDLQPLDLPANFSRVKRTYLRVMLGRSARAAEVVCVPSEFTRRRVLERLGVGADKVVVVPWSVVGLDRAAGALDAGSAGSDGTGIVADGTDIAGGIGTDIPDRAAGTESGGALFVYPAITYPHKNHMVLLEAFARLAAEVPDARLVLAGGEGPCEAEVRARIARPDLAGRVQRPGRVSTTEMERLYRRATAVVVPSRYEGFGLPAMEAMNRGVPVVVSAAGSLPEVVGGAGAVVAPVGPDDVTGWAEAMHAVLRLDPTTRASVVAAGRDRAHAYTPKRTADALAAAYHRAGGRGGTPGPGSPDHLP